MQYQSLFNLNIFHDYYQDNVCSDFKIDLTQACQKIIRGHRLLVHSTRNSFSVLMPVDVSNGSSKQPMIPFSDSFTFTFLLTLNNPDFTSFTQLDSSHDPLDSLYVFSNQTISRPSDRDDMTPYRLKPTSVSRSALQQSHGNQSALEQRLSRIVDLRISTRRQVFGVIEIHNNSSLPMNSVMDSHDPVEFQIGFTVKKRIWKYYLVAGDSTQPTTFSIHDKDSNITFSQTEIESGDRVLAQIRHRFPSSQPILFQSNEAIPCQEKGRRHIQLIRTGQQQPWIQHLPNPPDQHGTQVINALEEL